MVNEGAVTVYGRGEHKSHAIKITKEYN